MILDDAIKHAEEVAEKQEKMAKEWHENQVRKCDLFPFADMDYTNENECKECAAEHRQLAKWLKELRAYRKMYHKEHEDDCLREESEPQENDTEKRKEWPHKPCINYEDGCEEWAGCPCVYYKAETESENDR